MKRKTVITSLCHPYRKNGKTIILCFSDYQEYGKIGS